MEGFVFYLLVVLLVEGFRVSGLGCRDYCVISISSWMLAKV